MQASKSFCACFITQASLLKKDVPAEVFACDYRMAVPKLRSWRREIKAGSLCRLLGGGQVQLGEGNARNASGVRTIHDDDFARCEHVVADVLGVAVLEDQR